MKDRKLKLNKSLIGLLVLGTTLAAGPAFADFAGFNAGDLIVSTSTYEDTGAVANLQVGQSLPGGGAAVANGAYPNVFNNDTPDSSFGVSSPIILQDVTTSGALVSTLNLTQMAANQGVNLTTSFSSKSELAINLSTDGSALTFMGYNAAVGAIDVSNSNTPGNVDTTNTDTANPTYRSVVQLNASGTLQAKQTNAYSGNNGRGAILANGNYYLVGNAGNGSAKANTQNLTNVVTSTGVQLATPGGSANTTVVGTLQGTTGTTTGWQYGYSVTQSGYAADKSGKDDNFRGETIYNNTLYVTKGSGSNGVDTVYQVGTAGTLPTSATASATNLTPLPGLPVALAKTAISTTNPAFTPVGIWFANATTLYVADEGDGVAADMGAGSKTDPYAGLSKWTYSSGKWNLDYIMQSGLNLGVAYSVSDGKGNTYSVTGTDGLRNITGKINGNGAVTIYGVTSTVSGYGDQGADPNMLVAITDNLGAKTLPTGESFTILETAQYGQVLRGVAVTPTPLPGTSCLLGSGLAILIGLKRKFLG